MASREIRPGLIIAKSSCLCCARDVAVKLNKNLRAYHVCRWPVIETGNACNDQRRYSQKTTDQMIAAYQKQSEKPNERNTDIQPEPEREAEPTRADEVDWIVEQFG